MLDSKFQVIAHQVNCQGVMGAGVAKAIKNKYPEVYDEYYSYCQDNLKDDIFGTCLVIEADNGKIIANLFGQNEFGKGVIQTNYKKLHSALNELKDYMIENGLITLSFPYMIGCGLAGGDINIVQSLIRDVFDDTDIIYNFYNIN